MKNVKWLFMGLGLIAGVALADGNPYVGINLGYTTADFKSVASTTTAHLSSGSFDGGALAGYEQRFSGKFYLAGEVNLMGYDISSKYSNSSLGYLRYEQSYTYGLDVLPGFYIAPNVKLFVMGGLQAGSFRFKNEFAGNDFSKDRTLGAWDAGLGSDIVLNDNFSLRLNYKYIDYNTTKITSGSWSEKISPTNNQFNLAVLYRF